MTEHKSDIIEKMERLNETLKYEKIFYTEYGLDKMINVGFTKNSTGIVTFYPFFDEPEILTELCLKTGREPPINIIFNFYENNTTDGIINKGSLEGNIMDLRFV